MHYFYTIQLQTMSLTFDTGFSWLGTMIIFMSAVMIIDHRGCRVHLSCGEICDRTVKVLTKFFIVALHQSYSCECYR